MSKHHLEQIECTHCKHKQNFMMWDSLNGDLDPKAKQSLIDGTFFNFKCEKCGFEANVVYNTLYHDMTHNVMVYFVTPNMVETTKMQMEKASQHLEKFTKDSLPPTLRMPKTRNRIVTSQNRLREKAIIFNAGLDDRIVELTKMYCFYEISKQGVDVVPEDMYFYIETNGDYKIQIIDKGGCDVPKELYQQLETMCSGILERIGDPYIVDADFAFNILTILEQLAGK